MSVIGQAAMYWRFITGVREFLKEPVTVEKSREILRARLHVRERNFLGFVQKAVYGHAPSPYLKLLRLAGCEYGDLERMVKADGIENTLAALADKGVYVSYEEFKRGKEAVRGSSTFRFAERDFDNPLVSGQVELASGGSRGTRSRTMYDFEYLATQEEVYRCITTSLCVPPGVPVAQWQPIMPGIGPLKILDYYKIGRPIVRWFSPIDNKNVRPSLKNRLATNYIIYAGRLFGKAFPSPEYVALDEAGVIADYCAQTVKKYGGLLMVCYTSSAVRVCQAAGEKGLDIKGTVFTVGGEPLTGAKLAEITRAGAKIYSTYVFSEGGLVGYPCFNPVHTGEVHFFKDRLALIQRKREVAHAETTVDAFLFTTLLSSSPKVLFNWESGDYGVIEKRECGCEWEKLGFTEHIHSIRGFDKLTGEGMTFVGTDLVRIIEEVLPAGFGGASTDYQMLEEEDEKGHTRLSVIVSPKLGDIDEAEVIRVVLRELARGKDNQRMMAEMWAKAGTLRVKRITPFTTASGKLQPLHIRKK